jgi:hypothetical protein
VLLVSCWKLFVALISVLLALQGDAVEKGILENAKDRGDAAEDSTVQTKSRFLVALNIVANGANSDDVLTTWYTTWPTPMMRVIDLQ